MGREPLRESAAARGALFGKHVSEGKTRLTGVKAGEVFNPSMQIISAGGRERLGGRL